MCRIGTYKEVVIFLHAWSNPWANLQMTFSQRVELPLKCIFSFFLQRQKTTRENQKNPNTPPLRLSFKDKSVFFFLEPGGSAARLKPNQTGKNLQGLFWFVFLAKCVCIGGVSEMIYIDGMWIFSHIEQKHLNTTVDAARYTQPRSENATLQSLKQTVTDIRTFWLLR